MKLPRVPEWLRNSVFYQVYPQSFRDSNGDGIGDITGIIEKLDYVRSLGANAIWVNPCFVSPFHDAGYDVADYYRVATRYGSNKDLKRLFDGAHRRGIRVCLDLVAGHTSVDHPWFKASCENRRNAFSDRYIWTPSVWDTGDRVLQFVRGFAERDGNYATNFFWSQPALNYGFARPKPSYSWQQSVHADGPRANCDELRRIMSYWLDMGADGFRVDMAFSLVKGDPGRKETIRIWRSIRKWLNDHYPEAALIAEWCYPKEALHAGFHVDFMAHFGVKGYRSLFLDEGGKEQSSRCFFDTRGEGTVTVFLKEYLEHYRRTRSLGYISVPSGNHDVQRLRTNRGFDELKVIFVFLLTWPGLPFIYYGDEIGMRYLKGLDSKEGGYDRTGTRTPMQWDSTKNAGFSSAAPQELYIPIDPAPDRPTVSSQEKDKASLLNHVRTLIDMRKNNEALGADGAFVPIYAKPGRYPFVYMRRRGHKRFLIAINPAARKAEISFALKRPGSFDQRMARGAFLNASNGRARLRIDGISYGIFESNS